MGVEAEAWTGRGRHGTAWALLALGALTRTPAAVSWPRGLMDARPRLQATLIKSNGMEIEGTSTVLSRIFGG